MKYIELIPLEDHSIMNIQSLRIELAAEVQVILAQSHFIKTIATNVKRSFNSYVLDDILENIVHLPSMLDITKKVVSNASVGLKIQN